MAQQANELSRQIRPLRAMPDPLGLYIRVGRKDHTVLQHLLSADRAIFTGLVIDPTRCEQHRPLCEQASSRGVEVILDPRTQQSCLPGGYSERLGNLPWGIGRPHQVADFEGVSGRRLVGALADYAISNRFSQVMAPTHLLRTADDPWFQVDLEAAHNLRNHLDKAGATTLQMIYPLALPYEAFRNAKQRETFLRLLIAVPFAALWLRVENFGRSATATAVMNYLDAAASFHAVGKPIVADNVGGIPALSLLAFGAVGGIAHGVTYGERFEANSWRKKRSGGFEPHPRVYIRPVDLMLESSQARALVEASAKARSQFGCKDTECCPRGVTDMIQRPGQHFLFQRAQEVMALGRIPEQLRPQQFLERQLRPATDLALGASNIVWTDKVMAKKTLENRKRLDLLREALGVRAANNPPQHFALAPRLRGSR